jgi:hypothetical protein
MALLEYCGTALCLALKDAVEINKQKQIMQWECICHTYVHYAIPKDYTKDVQQSIAFLDSI